MAAINLFSCRTAFFSAMLMLQILLLSSPSISAADADPLQDFCVADLSSSSPPMNGFPCKPKSEVTSSDFFFDGLKKAANTDNTFGSKVTDGSVRSFPGLNTLGLSLIRVDIGPSGQNPPHVHPRATEILVVIEGTLLCGFTTADDKFFSKEVAPGEVFVIPRAMMHFQINRGKKHAYFFAFFNSQLPGVITVPTNLFATMPSVPNDVLQRAFQVSSNVVNEMKSKLKDANPQPYNSDESGHNPDESGH